MSSLIPEPLSLLSTTKNKVKSMRTPIFGSRRNGVIPRKEQPTTKQVIARRSNWKVYRLRGVYATMEQMFISGYLTKRQFVQAVDALVACKGSIAPNNKRPFLPRA